MKRRFGLLVVLVIVLVELSPVRALPPTWASQATTRGSLSGTQLNATADTAGTFEYSPGTGEVLPVGTHVLSVTFTPADAVQYGVVSRTASITVVRRQPTGFTLRSSTSPLE